MKKPTVLRLWAVLCTVVIFSACQKETSSVNEVKTNEDQSIRATGALPDDPAKLAKIPVIMSQEFLSNTQKFMTTPDMLSAKGKPVRSSTDATPPSVIISSPTNGSTVSGTVSIQVSATDNVAVASVSLSVDGTTIGTSSTAPYSFSWISSSGSHTIVATAKDAAGNIATNSISVSQNVVSADVTAPTVSITSPTSGSTVSGTVSVSVNASDNVGVKSVALSVDGTVVSTLTAAPFNFSWNTTNVADGNHSLSAKATDASGNINSSTITVAKNTTITTLPPTTTLPSQFELITPPVGYQGGEYNCAVFATVYAARSVEQFYKTSALSYSFTSNIFSPEFVYNKIKFSDNCGSGTSVTTALDFLKSNGVCTWQTMPYSYTNGCSLLPNNTQQTEASNYKISSYSWLYASDQTAIKNMLLNKHVVITTVTPDNSFNSAGPGFIWKSFSGTGGLGHSIVICGYDDAKHAYKIMNSWNTTWGDNGYSWIDYDFFPYTGGGVCYVITGL